MELIERDRELRCLASVSDATRAGSGRVVVVEGEAGIGKTALLRAAAAMFEGDGIATLKARGGELERDFGFGVARQLFEPALAGLPARSRRAMFVGAAALAAPVVVLDQRVPQRAVPDPVFAAQHGLYWLAVNLASLRPMALLVDDAHWSDVASMRWLLYVARRLEGVQLSLVLGWRSGDPGARVEVLDALRSEPSVEQLAPAGLTAEATSHMIRRQLPDAEDPFCAACHQATGGNPFFVGELTAAITEQTYWR